MMSFSKLVHGGVRSCIEMASHCFSKIYPITTRTLTQENRVIRVQYGYRIP